MSFRVTLVGLLALALRLAAADSAPPPPAPAAGNAVAASSDDDDEHPTAAKVDPAETKYWEAVALLGKKSPASQAAGRAALQAAADLELTHAQVLLADCYMSGSYGFPKDPKKAVNILRLAAERGNGFAKVSLGSCYFTGTGVRKDYDKAAEWLTAALAPDANFARPTPPADFVAPESDATVAGELEIDPVDRAKAGAHFQLGWIASQKKPTPESQAHFVAAATAGPDGRAGIYPAALQAALNYALGQGVPRDQAKANEMLDQSRRLTARMGVALIHNYSTLKIVDEFAVADLEESAAEAGAKLQTSLQMEIGSHLGNKKSKDYNAAEAMKWYELAANSGQAWAMLSLAFLYHEGAAGAPDDVKAFQWFEKAGGGDKPKHYLGVANLAICYQNGIGTTKDTAKAAALFTKHRDRDIICYLGTINQCPTTIQTFEQERELSVAWAKKKDPHAQYLLGLRYLGGWDGKIDVTEAVAWFRKAAKASHGGALNELGILTQEIPAFMDVSYDAKDRTALELYRKGGEAGNVSALVSYADMLDSGTGTTRDAARAEETYLRALKLDPTNARAHNNLAVLYEKKFWVATEAKNEADTKACREKFLHHFEEAVAQQYATAAKNLGEIYYNGKLVEQDYRKSYEYFEQASDWGITGISQYHLGMMHENGLGVPVTLSEAAYHYRLAALDGHIESLRRLINFYLTGQGVSLDLDRAMFWLQKMADAGFSGGLATMADIMLKKGDYKNAVALLKKLSTDYRPALAGMACERLGECYEDGTGVKAAPARAQKYYDRAVKLGNGAALTRLAMQQIKAGQTAAAIENLTKAAPSSPAASFFLGQMYFFGTNVPKNRTTAMGYLHQAAEGNHADALFFLAVMTYNNEADAPSLDEAIRLAERAENVGLTKATNLREKLENRRKKGGAPAEEKTKSRSS